MREGYYGFMMPTFKRRTTLRERKSAKKMEHIRFRLMQKFLDSVVTREEHQITLTTKSCEEDKNKKHESDDENNNNISKS